MYFALGVAALVMPTRILHGFGITVAGCDGRNEIRAVYGGFPLSVAGLLCAAMVMPHVANGILMAVSVATLGMATGRLLSALLDRRMGKLPMISTIVEILAAALIAAPLYHS